MPRDAATAWPDDARCAVLLTFSMPAELYWLQLDPSSKDRPKTLSMGEYGPRRGVERVLDVLDREGLRTTWFLPGAVALRYGACAERIAAGGHEVASLGFDCENLSPLSEEEQFDVLARSCEVIEQATGRRPVGFREELGELNSATFRVLIRAGFTYLSCMRGDDRPYFVAVDGESRALVEFPMQWELEDFPYFAFNYAPAFPAGQGRIASYSQVLRSWLTEFEAYYQERLCFVLTLHPEVIGTPGRIRLLEEFIAKMTSKGDVWVGTAAELSQWWSQNGPRNDGSDPMTVFAGAGRQG